MLEYTSEYKVLVCPLHKCAVADADRHLRFDHAITGKEKDALIQQWVHLETIPPAQQHRPSNGNAAREWLARPVDGFACQACPFLTIKWDYLAVHGKKAHGWSLPFRPEATKYPLQYATRVKIQTLFPYPHIRWFTVDEKAEQAAVENASVNCSASPHLARPISPSKTLDEMLAEYQTNLLKQRESEAEYQRTVLKQREGEARRLEVQRATAPKIRAANSQSFFLARIPLELRLQIYLLAIGEGAVFHIADINGPIKPALADARGTDEHDKENGRQDNDHMEVRTEWEYNMDEDLAMDNVGDTTCKMRAIALPDASRNCVAFLETCTQLYQEVSPLFYSCNTFIVHTRHQNFPPPRDSWMRCLQTTAGAFLPSGSSAFNRVYSKEKVVTAAITATSILRARLSVTTSLKKPSWKSHCRNCLH